MICKIEAANPKILAAVEYNEKKMTGEAGIHSPEIAKQLEVVSNGYILATRNVPVNSTLVKEFERLRLHALKKTGARLINQTFHMSVNPSSTDKKLTDEEYVSLIDIIMSDLGYEKQPYRIYKHTDIARTHFHIVSTRCGQKGKKINDSYDWKVLRRSLLRLAPKYGFTVIDRDTMSERKKPGKEEKRVEQKQKNEGEPMKIVASEMKYVPPFSHQSDIPVTEQFISAFEDTMKWNFSTFEQVQALMLRRYHILIEIERKNNEFESSIVLSGTSSDGKPITRLIKEDELGVEMLNRIRERCEKEKMSSRKEQRDRLEKLSRAAAKKASSYEEFCSIMERKGVFVVISWTPDGDPFGVTWLDRATKCAWKGSETSSTIQWLQEMSHTKGWIIKKEKYQVIVENRAKMPSRKPSIQIRHPMQISDVVIHPIFMPYFKTNGIKQVSSSSVLQHKGQSIYDESIRKGEEEELELKKNRGISLE